MKTFARITVLCASLVPCSWGQNLPAGEGLETLMRVCTQCHDIESISNLRDSRANWANLVYSRKDMGADATGAEAKNFGKGEDVAKKTNVNSAAAKEIETGLGFSPEESELIVQYRMTNGNFKDVDTLLKVKGVDAAKIHSGKEDKMTF